VSEPVPEAGLLQPLRSVQRSLQRFYRIETELDIADFLTTDLDGLRQFGVDPESRVGETVFVRGGTDSIEISVYVSPKTLSRLAASNESHATAGLNDYCLAAEGVSHFMFLVERAGKCRQTTAFELELQAEIDKYLLLIEACGEPSEGQARELHARLFDSASLREGLDAAAIERYGTASRYAARYCRYLQRLLREPSTLQRTMETELRLFYRLPLAEKVRRIDSQPVH
jgi:hypothetical protein